VYQFELLRSAFIQKSFNPFSDIPFIFFSFEGQKDPRGEAESLRHRNNRVETRDLLAALNVAPKIRGYVPTFGGSFEAKLSIPPEPAHAFGELGAMFQGSVFSHNNEHASVVTQSIECFYSRRTLYRVLRARLTGRIGCCGSLLVDCLHDSEGQVTLIRQT